MKKKLSIFFISFVLIVLGFSLLDFSNFKLQPHNNLSDPQSSLASKGIDREIKAKDKVTEKITGIKVPFISNHGQMDKNVKFYAPIFSGTVFVTESGKIVYAFNQKAETESKKPTLSTFSLTEEIVGAKVNKIVGEKKTDTKINIFHGNDQSKWKSNLPSFDVVSLGEVYEGIELKLKAYGNTVEKLFYVKKGADPECIIVKVGGGNKLSLDSKDMLHVGTEHGDVKFSKPVAYQENGGKKEYIEVAYVVEGDEYGFKVGEYDHGKELIIDPILAATFIGGSDRDLAYAVTIDSMGNVYVAGTTNSVDFPGINPDSADNTINSSLYAEEGFIVKLDNNLTTILAATFIGGDEVVPNTVPSPIARVLDIKLDSMGNVYITGTTSSQDFPGIGPSSADNTFGNGAYEGFIAKLNSDLSSLIAATFIGGNASDVGYEMVINSSGDLYVVGLISLYLMGLPLSLDFPGIGPSSADSFFQGSRELFVVKFSSDLNTIIASTFVGGNSREVDFVGPFSSRWASIDLDSTENVFIASHTNSDIFPGIGLGSADNIKDNLHPEQTEAIVVKLNPSLSSIMAATYLGGNEDEHARAIVIDGIDNVFVGGATASVDFPGINPDSADNTLNLSYFDAFFANEVFIVKLDNNLTTILDATYLGGNNGISQLKGLALDSNGSVYATGYTESAEFPGVTPASEDNIVIGYDSFFAILDNGLSTVSATYLGGSGSDIGNGIAVMSGGFGEITYIVGSTSSPDFPEIMRISVDNAFAGATEAFVVKLSSFANTSIFDLEYILNAVDTCFPFCPPPLLIAIKELILTAIDQVSVGSKLRAASTLQELINNTQKFIASGTFPRELGTELIQLAGQVQADLTENLEIACSNLGNNRFHFFPDIDSFKFRGMENEVVTITLDLDPDGENEAKNATLILSKFIPGAIFEITRAKVPNLTITALRADGNHRITIVEQPFHSNGFIGDYCLTIESESGSPAELIPTWFVE